MQTVAINIAANTTLPGFRGPIYRLFKASASGLDPEVLHATLTTHDPPDWDGPRVDWRPPDWGAYATGEFVVDEVLSSPEPADLPEWTASNAHVKRETVDATVFVRGAEGSRLFDRAVPLSESTAGTDANDLVTALSNDSGRGPWWRRVLRYDAAASERLEDRLVAPPSAWMA